MLLNNGLPDGLQTALELPVQLAAFEGPLDLLLYLLRREEIDIYDIPIARLTSQYLGVLRSVEHSQLDIAGEFFVMAATLMLIKSRMLLPIEAADVPEDSAEMGADPRHELVEQLLEYKKFKEASEIIESVIDQQGDVYSRVVDMTQLELVRPVKAIVPLELTSLFSSALVKLKARLNISSIHGDAVTVPDRIAYIIAYLLKKPRFRFGEFWDVQPSNIVVGTTFLAVLELCRLKELSINQEKPFAPIYCVGTVKTH